MSDTSEKTDIEVLEELRGGLHTLQDALIPDEEAWEAVDDTVDFMVLVQGESAEGKPFYAYLSVSPSKYEAFMQAQAEGEYNLDDYGTVLAMGDEEEPPEDVKLGMEILYGLNHNFEEEFSQGLRQNMMQNLHEEKGLFEEAQKELREAKYKMLEEGDTDAPAIPKKSPHSTDLPPPPEGETEEERRARIMKKFNLT